MKNFEFLTYITVEAESYDEAIDVFQFQLKYGINKDNVYVADIKDLELSEWRVLIAITKWMHFWNPQMDKCISAQNVTI